MRPLLLSKPRMQTRKRARMAGVASQPDGEFAWRLPTRWCSAACCALGCCSLYGCAECGGSRGIAGARSSPRQPPLHPHAHALPSPLSPCACRRLHRGNPPRAMGALPAAGRCEPAQCARRSFMSRRKATARRGISGRFGLSRAVCAPRAAMGMLAHCDRSAACLLEST